MNGKLVIRVGGGYMIIEEFISTYADIEINRCKLIEAQQMMANEGGNAASGGDGYQRAGSRNKSPRPSGSPKPLGGRFSVK